MQESNSFEPCRYRSDENNDNFCDLARKIAGIGASDQFQVTPTTCEMCATYFEPTIDEPNPVVASLANHALDSIIKKRQWLQQFQRQQLNPENVDRNGIVIRSKQTAGELRDRQVENTGFYLVRQRGNGIANSLHESNWPCVFDALQAHHNPTGIVLDDMIEERFGQHMGSVGYHEPWIGIFHHPMDDTGYAGPRLTLDSMFATPAWRASLPFLKGAIAMSTHNANLLANHLQVPTVAIKHPLAQLTNAEWCPRKYQANPQKFLLQTDWYQHNTQAIYDVPEIPLRKLRVLPSNETPEAYDRRLRQQRRIDDHLPGTAIDRPIERVMLQPDEWENAFTENVIFIEALADSVNQVLLTCIAASTPVVANRHPTIVEYLGEDYPLYYSDKQQIPALCSNESLLAAHQYLQQLDKSWLLPEAFAVSAADAVATWTE